MGMRLKKIYSVYIIVLHCRDIILRRRYMFFLQFFFPSLPFPPLIIIVIWLDKKGRLSDNHNILETVQIHCKGHTNMKTNNCRQHRHPCWFPP